MNQYTAIVSLENRAQAAIADQRYEEASVLYSRALTIAHELRHYRLMVAFYRHYLAHDHKAHALQCAMQELRTLPSYTHPRDWAAFVVVGAEA